MDSRRLALAGLFLLLSLALQTKANYTLEVKAHSYKNDDHRLADGDCCEVYLFKSHCDFFLLCGKGCKCDNEFVFCLRNADHPEDKNEDDCPLGRFVYNITLMILVLF